MNNPLYAQIAINEEEMNSWSFEDGSKDPADGREGLPAQPPTVEDIAMEPAERSKHRPARAHT